MTEITAIRARKPELMSPAGHWPQLEAAIRGGADAVYFGLQHFSARAKVGFPLGELPEVIRTLHQNAVKGFVTFNTLVFDHELRQAEDTIIAIAQSGADAIIVQDIGIAKLARQIAPGLDIHGSTQMSITSAEGAELAASFGCCRVVLGRELELRSIRAIAEATDVELEVFVHGALCVSYSGQCFSSEAWGGRSANRGQCAQACRLSYELMVDDQLRDLGQFRYLLSPGDLYALDQVPELMKIGVACLKIEGRYKDEHYVSLTTRAYRQAIDEAWQESGTADPPTVTKNELEQIYSRGLGPHFLAGIDHQRVVIGRAPRHRGLQVAVVTGISRQSVIVRGPHSIQPGDGVVFDSANWRSPNEPEEGGSVFAVDPLSDGDVELHFGRGAIDFDRIRVDDLLWRTSDPQLIRKARRLNQGRGRTTGIRFAATAAIGHPLLIEAETDRHETARFIGNQPLAAARSEVLALPMLEQQLGRLGGTAFHLQAIEWTVGDAVFCPVSELNHARRAIVSQLMRQREHTGPVTTKSVLSTRLGKMRSAENAASDTPIQLHLLVRNAEQLGAAISFRPDSITLDYLELYGLRPSVERIREAGIAARVASPRILKPSEQNVVRFLRSLECQILIRSGGLLHELAERTGDIADPRPQLFGDFSLNAANAISVDEYLRLGLLRVTPSHDLNSAQIGALTRYISANYLEVVAYHQLPVFHTEHCVFCRFLSDGTDSSNCGHPCERHRISLRDGSGLEHPVLADVGCRNTVFGAQAQAATNQLKPWLDAGIRHFRIEYVHHSAAAVMGIADAFRKMFAQEIDTSALDRILRHYSPQGTTAGSLFVPSNHLQLVQLN